MYVGPLKLKQVTVPNYNILLFIWYIFASVLLLIHWCYASYCICNRIVVTCTWKRLVLVQLGKQRSRNGQNALSMMRSVLGSVLSLRLWMICGTSTFLGWLAISQQRISQEPRGGRWGLLPLIGLYFGRGALKWSGWDTGRRGLLTRSILLMVTVVKVLLRSLTQWCKTGKIKLCVKVWGR